jgi:hypothetical protein
MWCVQGDPVRDLVFRYMGEQEAVRRHVLTADSVPQDVEGLQRLVVRCQKYKPQHVLGMYC